MLKRAVTVLSLLMLISACSSGGDEIPEAMPAASHSDAAAAAHAAAGVNTSPGVDASGKTVGYGIITATIPDGWLEKPVKSQMRQGNYTLPKIAADNFDAEMVVYYFGQGQGGAVQANLDRWASQFKQPDGKNSKDLMKSSTLNVGSFSGTLADVTGTYQRPTNPNMMMSPTEDAPGWRMLAAIVDTDQGPYFFKLVGPEATVNNWEGSFGEYLKTLR